MNDRKLPLGQVRYRLGKTPVGITDVSHFQPRNLISLRCIRVVGFRLPHGRTPIENDGQSIAQSSAHADIRDVQQITSFAVVGLGGSTVYPSFT